MRFLPNIPWTATPLMNLQPGDCFANFPVPPPTSTQPFPPPPLYGLPSPFPGNPPDLYMVVNPTGPFMPVPGAVFVISLSPGNSPPFPGAGIVYTVQVPPTTQVAKTTLQAVPVQ